MRHTSPEEMLGAINGWREAAAIVGDDVEGCPVRGVLDKVGGTSGACSLC